MLEVLKFRRKELKLTLDDVARMVGCSKQYVSQIETGKRNSLKFNDKYFTCLKLNEASLNLEEKMIYYFYQREDQRFNFYNYVASLEAMSKDDYKVYLIAKYFISNNPKYQQKIFNLIRNNEDYFGSELTELFYLYNLYKCLINNDNDNFIKIFKMFDFKHKNMITTLEVRFLVNNERYIDSLILISNYLKDFSSEDKKVTVHLNLIRARVMVLLGELTRANHFLEESLKYNELTSEIYLLLASNYYLLGDFTKSAEACHKTKYNDKYILLSLIKIEEGKDYTNYFKEIDGKTKKSIVFKNLIKALYPTKDLKAYQKALKELKELAEEDKLSDLKHYVYKFEQLKSGKTNISNYYLAKSIK